MKLVLLLLTFVACNFEIKTRPSKTPTPVETPVEFKGRWNNPSYDKLLYNALINYGQELLKVTPVDAKDFINVWPTNSDGVLKFWMNTIVEMAYFESGWKTATQYKENFKDQKGNYIVSRGLLQISIESGKGYDCPLATEQDRHDPKINLECGVRILNRWVVRDNRIAGKVNNEWKGGSRYWSVLRQEIGEVKKSTDAIKAINKVN